MIIWAEASASARFFNRGEGMDLFFYDVDPQYIKYLKQKEIEKRGFTRVPDIEYKNEKKMVCGIVLEINDYKYYVPISSYKKKRISS